MLRGPAFEVERFEWRAAGCGAARVELSGRWAVGEEPDGRAALVAEDAGTLVAVAPLPSPLIGRERLAAVVSVPVERVEGEGVGFAVRAEGRPAMALDRPRRAAPEGASAEADAEPPAEAPGEPAPAWTPRRELERRLRHLERDLERERMARAGLEHALEEASETTEALVRVRGEKTDLDVRAEELEADRDRLGAELAAASRSARESDELARTRASELETLRGEAAGTARQLQAALGQADELRAALSSEQEARAGAERAAREARKERDAAFERTRAQLAGMVDAAVARDLEREAVAAREAAAAERGRRAEAEAARTAEEARARALAERLARAESEREARTAARGEVEAELERLAEAAREVGARAAGTTTAEGSSAVPDPERIEEVRRAVRHGREEAAELERRVADLRTALEHAS